MSQGEEEEEDIGGDDEASYTGEEDDEEDDEEDEEEDEDEDEDEEEEKNLQEMRDTQRELAKFSDNPDILDGEINDTEDMMKQLSETIANKLDEDRWENLIVTNIASEVQDTDQFLYVPDSACYKLVQQHRQLKIKLELQKHKRATLTKRKSKVERDINVVTDDYMSGTIELKEIFEDEKVFRNGNRLQEYKRGVRRRSLFNRWMIYRMKTSANEDRKFRSGKIDADYPWGYDERRILAKRERLETLYKSYFKASEKDDYNIDMYVVREMIMDLPDFTELNMDNDMADIVMQYVKRVVKLRVFEDEYGRDREVRVKDKSSVGLVENEERKSVPEDSDDPYYELYIFGSSDDEFESSDNVKSETAFLRAYDENDDDIIQHQRMAQCNYLAAEITKFRKGRFDRRDWEKKYYKAKQSHAHKEASDKSDRRDELCMGEVPQFPKGDVIEESRDEEFEELKKKGKKKEEYSDPLTEEEEGEDEEMLDEFKFDVVAYNVYQDIVKETEQDLSEYNLQKRVKERESGSRHISPEGMDSPPLSSSDKKGSQRRISVTPPWKPPEESPKKKSPKKKKSPRVIPTPRKPSPEKKKKKTRTKFRVRTEILCPSSESESSSSDDDDIRRRFVFEIPVEVLDNATAGDKTLTSDNVIWLNKLLFDMDLESTVTLKALRGATMMIMKLLDRLGEVYGMLKTLNKENDSMYPVVKFGNKYVDDLEKEFVKVMELCTDIELQNESLYTATKIGVPMVKDFLNGLHTCSSLLMILDEMDDYMYKVCLNSRMIFNENARFVKVNRDLAKRNIHLERRQGLFEETKKKYEDMKVIETRYIEMAKLHKQREENENAIKIEKADERDEELMSRAMRKENNAILKAWKDLRKSEVEFLVKKKKEEMEAKEKPDTEEDHMPFVFAPVSAPSVSQEITRGDMWNAHVSKFSRDFITRLEHPFRELNDIINDHYAKVRRSFHAIQTVVEDIKIIRLPVMDTRCLDPPSVLLDNADFSCYNGDHRRVNFGRKGCYTILCCTNHLEELENRRGIVLLDKHYSYSDKYWNLVFETDG